MKANSTLTRAALAAAACATAFGVLAPSTASAQSYGYGGGYSSNYDNRGGYAYDGCRREQNSRATLGALAGAAAGIALGNNVSRDRSSRRNAAAAGGVLGAVIGSQVGKNGAACEPGYGASYNSGYSTYQQAPAYQTYGYEQSYAPQYSRDRYDRRGDYYDRYQERYAETDGYARDYATPSRADTNNRCTYAESPVYMPDGSTQTRMVQVCPDRNGRYQVVQ